MFFLTQISLISAEKGGEKWSFWCVCVEGEKENENGERKGSWQLGIVSIGEREKG